MNTHKPFLSLLQKMFASSILLHAGAFIWFNQHSLVMPETPPDKFNIEVTLTRIIQEDNIETPSENVLTENDSEELSIAADDSRQTDSNTESIKPVVEALFPESPPSNVTQSNATIITDDMPKGISQQELSNSISSYLMNYKAQLNQEAVAECLRYQNRHGSRDCPRGSSAGYSLLPEYIFRSKNADREKLDSLQHIKNLRGLMAANSVLANLAATQYYLARNRYGGNTSSMLSSTTNNAIAGDRTFNILGSSGGLVNYLLGGSALHIELTRAETNSLENHVEKRSPNNFVERFQVATPVLLSR